MWFASDSANPNQIPTTLDGLIAVLAHSNYECTCSTSLFVSGHNMCHYSPQ